MKSRIPAAVHLTAEKVIKKFLRGFTEQTVRNDGKVNVLEWFDQKPILLASTALGQHPTDNCKRWSKKDSKYMLVPRLCIVKCYNDSMGGINPIGRMISYYQMSARTKKWTVKTIFHLIDLALAHSWILYRENRKKLGDAPKYILQFHAFKLEVEDSFFTDNHTNDENSVLPLRLTTRNNPEGYTQSPVHSNLFT
ncbi:hypothetical protein JTB14_011309 [Gonioctena quinquepunctata]|nr:hypothetical protein JTB14_011309 [Gonioctena quinquepunctata]